MTEDEHEDSGGIGEETSQGGGSAPRQDQSGEGDANQRATPPIEEQGRPGQTQVPAPDDDVGGQRGGQDRPE